MSEKDLAEIRQAFFGTDNSTGAFTAKIKSVDADKRLCIVVDHEDMEYEEVLLYSVENVDLKGFVMIPKVDSTVLVSRIGGSNELYVAMFSEVEKVLLTIGDKVEVALDDKELIYKNDKVNLKINGKNVEVDAEKIVFNGGHNKGLVKIEELTDKINALVDAFNSHTHKLMSGTVVVSGSPTSQTNPAPIEVPAITAKTQKLNKTDYENEKITH